MSLFVTLNLDMCMVVGTLKGHEALSVPIICFAAISAGEQSLNVAEIFLVMRRNGLLVTAGLGGDKSLSLMFPLLPCRYQGISHLSTSKYLYEGIKEGGI